MEPTSRGETLDTTILFPAGFVGIGLLVATFSVLAWRAESAEVRSFGWVRHTLEVERDLTLIQSKLTDAETGQRGFLSRDCPI